MVLDGVANTGRIYAVWQDESWTVDGADVRVSIVCATWGSENAYLNGFQVPIIHADLTSGSVTIAGALPLEANKGRSFVGVQKNGPFDVDGKIARTWLAMPVNPNGRPNSDVLKRSINGGGIAGRDPDRWLIDFGLRMSERDAALYEEPFKYVEKFVKPTRIELRRDWHRTNWWMHGDPRPAFRTAIQGLTRYVVTPMVSKHRLFVFVNTLVLPENKAVAFARDDLTFFGILQSRFHELWSLSLCSYIGVGNDPSYSPSRCFDTFAFPAGLEPNVSAASYAHEPRAQQISDAAGRLYNLRGNWLNPIGTVVCLPEVVPGYPGRVQPLSEEAAGALKKRTLTNLYNERPFMAGQRSKRLRPRSGGRLRMAH